MVRAGVALGLFALVLSAGCLKNEKEEALENGAHAVTGPDAKKAFEGNTMTGTILGTGSPIPFTVFMAPDGRTSGAAMGDHDRGVWRVAADGTVCMKWNRWQDNKENCSAYFLEGDKYKVFLPQGGIASVATILPGNPRKLELRSDREIALEKGGIAPLAADEAKAELTGNTLSGSLKQVNDAPYHAFYDADGKIAAKVSGGFSDDDKGVWNVKDSGEVCVKWTKWNDGHETCGQIYRVGKKLSSFTPDGTLSMVAVARKGNPEKLVP